MTLIVLPHYLAPQCPMTGIGSDIDGGGRCLEAGKELRQRILLISILPGHDGGDSLTDRRQRPRHLEQPILVVTVGVNESRSQHQTICIDKGVLCRRLKIPNVGNAVPHDAHVHVPGGATATIDDPCIDDHHASGLWHIGGAGRQREYQTGQNRQGSLDHRPSPENGIRHVCLR